MPRPPECSLSHACSLRGGGGYAAPLAAYEARRLGIPRPGFHHPFPEALLRIVSLLVGANALALASPSLPQQFVQLVRQHAPREFVTGAHGTLRDVDGDSHVDVMLHSGSILMGDGLLGFTWSPPGARIALAGAQRQSFHAVAEITGDGLVDIVSIDTFFGRVTVGPGQPGGSWGAPIQIATTAGGGGIVGRFAAKDIDGDLDDDLLVGVGASMRVLLNAGTGTFADVTGSYLLAPMTPFAAIDDFDGDGRVDLIGANGGMVQMLRNSGSGTFLPAVGTMLPPGNHVESGDVDADGDVDLLLANGSGQPFQVWVNNGAGVFQQSPAAIGIQGYTFVFEDFDVDGDADVMLVDVEVPNSVMHFTYVRNTGGAFTTVSTLVSDMVEQIDRPSVGDLDHDGDVDFVMAETVFCNDGTDHFTQLLVQPVRLASGVHAAPLLGDLDGDGFVDLVTGMHVHRNRHDGTFAPQPTLAANTIARAMVDFDLDGDPDVVWNTVVGPLGGVLRNQNGVLTPHVAFGANDCTGNVVVADFDGDGDADLVSESRKLLQNTAGTFTVAGILAPGSTPLAAGDVDGDGDADLVVTSASGWQVVRNQGAFVFHAPTQWHANTLSAAVLFDHDGDGDLDVAGTTLTNLRVWQNTAGSMQLVTTLAEDAFMYRLGAADVDGDGRVDLIGHHAWRNLGGGAFTSIDTGAAPDATAAVADLDTDGDLDIVRSGYGGMLEVQRPRVYSNCIRQLRSDRVPILGRAWPIEVVARPLGGTGGDLVVLALAASTIPPTPVPGLGLLHLDPATLVVGPGGLTGANGAHRFVLQLPSTPGLTGLEVFWQALVFGPNEAGLTNLMRDTFLR
jgi:hypothetical protein